MFIIKKLITPFILLPGIFILFFLAGGVALLVCKHRKTGLAAIIAGVIMWSLSIAPLANILLLGLTRDFSSESHIPEGDVIVLLGGGVEGRLIDLSGRTGILSQEMVVRTVTAARLFRRLKVPVIVSGGDPFGRGVVEAEVAKRYLVDMGVAAAAVIQESASRDTFQNAERVRELCVRHGFEKPILITSAYHLKRALWCFEKVGLTCQPFANGMASIKGKTYSWEDYLPASYEAFSQYLHEYIGLIYYRLAY